jgi:hypothetical protein
MKSYTYKLIYLEYMANKKTFPMVTELEKSRFFKENCGPLSFEGRQNFTEAARTLKSFFNEA